MNAYILNYRGCTAEVIPFTSSYDSLNNVPIVDAIIAYDCPFSGNTYLLVCHISLSVSSITHNLIPPFFLIEANIIVNYIPRIQSPDLDDITHSIWFPVSGFCIALSLRGIFSYLLTFNQREKSLFTPRMCRWWCPKARIGIQILMYMHGTRKVGLIWKATWSNRAIGPESWLKICLKLTTIW